jgi:uncharacterized protein YdeI (BOF family)
MKGSSLSAAVLSVAFGLCFLATSPNGNSLNASPARRSAAQEQSQNQNQVRAFTGTIAKTGDKYVLRDDSSRSMYDLDDQSSAGKFAGKKVKVTGTLDAANHTIHVQTIEEASA